MSHRSIAPVSDLMRKGDATRQAIVNEALTQSLSLGLEGVSLGGLANSLNLSKSGLFAHFKSKEALQLAVLQEAIDRFASQVVVPALVKPPGEPRVRALFENYVTWVRGKDKRAGCLLMNLSAEYDDRPGKIRDLVVASQREWRRVIAGVAEKAMELGHFRADLDPELFAFELVGIAMVFHQSHKLLRDPDAERLVQKAFEHLLATARTA